MQVKIVIGTVAFMMTMMLFGYAALREPARLERFAAADLARNVEKGADIFFNNCSSCHGVEGDAVNCFDTTGEQIGCVGLPLRDSYLLCEPSSRLQDVSYEGTVRDYVFGTVYAGRVGTEMPTWSANLGGPMQDYEIENVTQFVLNWQHDLCGGDIIVETVDWPLTVTALLEMEGVTATGDTANGQSLYDTTYACNSCHGDLATEGSNRVGPWLGDLAERGDDIVEGYAAADYTYESILNPNAHIAENCPTGPCNSPSQMPGNFSARIREPQSMIDLLAYILGGDLESAGVEINYAPR